MLQVPGELHDVCLTLRCFLTDASLPTVSFHFGRYTARSGRKKKGSAHPGKSERGGIWGGGDYCVADS